MATMAQVCNSKGFSSDVADILLRIFRTDYGHTEVAAHFGNGECYTYLLHVSIDKNKLDPREYCISTKDFVLTEEGKLKGLNTSA